MGEVCERYRVRILRDGVVLHEADVGVPEYTVPEAVWNDAVNGGAFVVAVAQLSDQFGPGPFVRRITMANETMRLQLPLLQPAQAQKHVTVNEALMRLDGLTNAVLESASVTVPPEVVIDGQSWGVPQGASGAWAGQGGRIAVGANGGWVFVAPSRGMRAFVADRGVEAVFDGQGWFMGATTFSSRGSGLSFGMAEGDVTVGTGASFDTGIAIPAGAMVIGAVARVTQALTGGLATWRLGTADSNNRFGQGLGKGAGSWARGMLGAPMTYYNSATLLMTGEGGGFTGGKVRLAVHWMELRLPD